MLGALATRRSLLAADMVGDAHHGVVAVGGLTAAPRIVAPAEEAHQGVGYHPRGVEVAYGGELGQRGRQGSN